MSAIEVGAAVRETVGHVLSGQRKATKYLDPRVVVKATGWRKPTRRDRTATVIVTVGVPNYAERHFIKQAKKAGEPFPIKRVQLKDWKRGRR